MSELLTHIESFNGQELEISVIFDIKNNEVEKIFDISVKYMGLTIPVGDLFISHISEMDVAIDKIISRVDWMEIYNNLKN